MEEEKNPDLSSLHYPVSDFLWFNSDEYKGYARVNREREPCSQKPRASQCLDLGAGWEKCPSNCERLSRFGSS